jgi:DNA repair protein RecO (recombination protein O)
MDERTTGIILRLRLLTDTSLIVQWLTPDLGRIATVAKGARRPKSPFAGKIDLFFLAEFSFQRSRRSDLHNLREIGLRETSPGLRQELQYVRQAAYAAQLIEQTTETETPLPNIYTLLLDYLRFLPQYPPRALPVFAFELKLLHELGLGPDLTASSLSAGASRVMTAMQTLPWVSLGPLRMARVQEQETSNFLGRHLAEHLGKVLPNRPLALSLGVGPR